MCQWSSQKTGAFVLEGAMYFAVAGNIFYYFRGGIIVSYFKDSLHKQPRACESYLQLQQSKLERKRVPSRSCVAVS